MIMLARFHTTLSKRHFAPFIVDIMSNDKESSTSKPSAPASPAAETEKTTEKIFKDLPSPEGAKGTADPVEALVKDVRDFNFGPKVETFKGEPSGSDGHEHEAVENTKKRRAGDDAAPAPKRQSTIVSKDPSAPPAASKD